MALDMKHSAALVLALVVLLLLPAAAKGGRLRYYNTAVGFSFHYPAGWRSAPLPNNDGTMLTNPAFPGASMKAWGFSLTSGTLEREAAKTENLLKNDTLSFAMVKQKTMTVGSDRALWRAYAFKRKGQSGESRALGVSIGHKGLVFVFLGACPSAQWARLLPVFEAMARSFKAVSQAPEATNGGER